MLRAGEAHGDLLWILTGRSGDREVFELFQHGTLEQKEITAPDLPISLFKPNGQISAEWPQGITRSAPARLTETYFGF